MRPPRQYNKLTATTTNNPTTLNPTYGNYNGNVTPFQYQPTTHHVVSQNNYYYNPHACYYSSTYGDQPHPQSFHMEAAQQATILYKAQADQTNKSKHQTKSDSRKLQATSSVTPVPDNKKKYVTPENLETKPSQENFNKNSKQNKQTISTTEASEKLLDLVPKKVPSLHKLQDAWSMWFCRFGTNFSWEHSQTEVSFFETVEHFWKVYDALPLLTNGQPGCNYSMFKKGIRPIWEDPANKNGGRFVFNVEKKNEEQRKYAQELWLDFVLALIGNMLPHLSDQICGIVGGNRNDVIRIGIWTSNCEEKIKLMEIGNYFKKLCNYKHTVVYEVHMDNQSRNNKNSFEI